MKNLKKAIKYSFMMIGISIFLFSCTKDEVVDSTTQEVENTEIEKSAEVDKATEAMDDIALEVFEKQQYAEDNGENADFSSLPDCLTITVVIAVNSREITLDFGTEGCEVNGNVFMGKIILSYERFPSQQEVLITKTLEDFYVNNKNVIGSKTILKELSNDNGNPQFTHTTDFTVIWPSDLTASRAGVRIKEMVEGAGNDIYSDNVFEITGTWNATFVNGNSRTYEVLTPLRREVICDFFVSGSIDVEKENVSGILDFGSGDCDNQAVFTTDDGQTYNITLN